jgi:hypothetical protein
LKNRASIWTFAPCVLWPIRSSNETGGLNTSLFIGGSGSLNPWWLLAGWYTCVSTLPSGMQRRRDWIGHGVPGRLDFG